VIPVEQRQLWRPDDHPDGPQSGDCLRACAASIFEVPYEEVADLRGDSQNLWTWARERIPGLYVVKRHLSGLDGEGDPESWRSWPTRHHERGYWIASVYSYRIPDVHEFGCGCASRTNGVGDPECRWCAGKPHERSMGIRWGLHAVVMHGAKCVWDPHPERDKGFGPFRSATTFHVEDPALLAARPELAVAA